MTHAITVGDLIWPAVIIAGGLGLLGIAVWVLSIFADAWKH